MTTTHLYMSRAKPNKTESHNASPYNPSAHEGSSLHSESVTLSLALSYPQCHLDQRSLSQTMMKMMKVEKMMMKSYVQVFLSRWSERFHPLAQLWQVGEPWREHQLEARAVGARLAADFLLGLHLPSPPLALLLLASLGLHPRPLLHL